MPLTFDRIAHLKLLMIRYLISSLAHESFYIICVVVSLILFVTYGWPHFGPGSVESTNIDAASVAAEAIDKYDTDRDKNISKEECRTCPSLNGSFELYDSDGDGVL